MTTLIIPIGAFIAACINFLIVALVLFFVVKAYNRSSRRKRKRPARPRSSC